MDWELGPRAQPTPLGGVAGGNPGIPGFRRLFPKLSKWGTLFSGFRPKFGIFGVFPGTGPLLEVPQGSPQRAGTKRSPTAGR